MIHEPAKCIGSLVGVEDILAYVNTCTHTYIYACARRGEQTVLEDLWASCTYIHTYTHTYIHTYMCREGRAKCIGRLVGITYLDGEEIELTVCCHLHTHLHTHTYTYTHIHTHTHGEEVELTVCSHVCAHTCMNTHTSTTHIYSNIHTYIHTFAAR